MVQEQATISKKSVSKQKCQHHWAIESPAGRTSKGVCILCGAQREFKNYLRDCLGGHEEEYLGWRRRQGYEEKEKHPEEDVLSQLRGGDKDAAKVGS